MQSIGANQSTVFSLCYDFHLTAAFSQTGNPCQFPAHTTGDNGNVFQVLDNVDSTRSAAYIYDSLNRIAQAYTLNTTSANCWGETYSATATAPGVLPSTPGIDAWGNLTNRSGVTGMTGCATEPLSATANTNNQLSILTYDAAGNVTNDGNGNQPTYDAENRIATDAGVTYSYDANGFRMEKSSGTMYWPGSSGEVLAETDLMGAVNEEYIFFNGQRLARVDRPSGTVHDYISDHLGSASLIYTPGSGTEYYYYYPYGGLVASVGSDSNRYKFTGKERDAESGLDNFGARYNASNLGRFMSPDVPVDQHPENPQSWNLYSYVRNNPLSSVDQDGNYDCGQMTAAQCTQFGDDLAGAQNQLATAHQNGDITDAQFKEGSNALGAFGTLNDHNGVTVNVGATGGYPGTTTVSNDGTVSAANPTGQNIQVTFNPGVFDGGNNNAINGVVAHEGSHVEDGEAWAKAGFTDAARPTSFDTEFKAYGVTSIFGAAQGAGMLQGTKPGDATAHLFWMKRFPDVVNNALRTNMIKTLYPNWAEKVFEKNTNPERK